MADQIRDLWIEFSKKNVRPGAPPHARALIRQAFYAGATASIYLVDKAAETDNSGVALVQRMNQLRLETRAFADGIDRPPA